MSSEIAQSSSTRVYTTADGHAAIEQSDARVLLSAQQILTVIRELQVCYDYCAAWKLSPRNEEHERAD